MKLFVLNSKPADPNGYIFQALVRALRRQSGLQVQVIRSDELGQISHDPNSQSLLVYGGEELHQIHRDQIVRPFGRRAIWFTEDPYEARRNRESAELFHIVFSNDTGSLNIYEMAHHLPLASDPDLIPKRPHREPEKLLFFSGTAWPNRKRLLNTLIHQWSNAEALDLHLVANKFVEQQLDLTGINKALRFEEPISISDFGMRAANSLCTLVVGRDFSGSGQHSYARSPGPRLFEAGITGSCQLVHASEIPDMPAGLNDGQHYLRFSTTEELVDLLRQAKIDPKPFRAIGGAMASEIRAQHTYDQRAAVIVESLMNCEPEEAEEAYSPETSTKLRALFISHEQTKPGFQHGGAGLCLDQIVAAAPNDVDVRILCRTGDDGHSFTLLDRFGRQRGGFRCQHKVTEYSLHHPEFNNQIKKLLKEWKPQLVHVNHLLGFTPAILPLARNAGACTSITLHDYYTICDSWNLLDNQHSFCEINNFFDERCQSCCTNRRPQFRSVDPIRRRITMSEALIHAQAVIVPSSAAEKQVRKVLPHLPSTHVIEPSVHESISHLKPGEGNELIVLIPGNMAINKGYLELRDIIVQSNDLGLPIQFRVLGRVEAWIQQELTTFANVKLLGRYNNQSFNTKATGADLALFLSPWPETYCITFDEWKHSGRACMYYAVGALAEAHRQQGLHQASRGFGLSDHDGLMHALIQATTPAGLEHLREPNTAIQASTASTNFGVQHWKLFEEMLTFPKKLSPNRWTEYAYQQWANEHETPAILTTRQRLKQLIYRMPKGHKLAALWRKIRGR